MDHQTTIGIIADLSEKVGGMTFRTNIIVLHFRVFAERDLAAMLDPLPA